MNPNKVRMRGVGMVAEEVGIKACGCCCCCCSMCVCVPVCVTDGELQSADRPSMLPGWWIIFGNLQPLLLKGAFISNCYKCGNTSTSAMKRIPSDCVSAWLCACAFILCVGVVKCLFLCLG